MGLDMYLDKHVYVGAVYPHRKVNVALSITADDKPIRVNPTRITEIVERVGYWRKANAIHAWFVQNVQDGEDNCGTYYVTADQLQELLNTVNAVLKDVTLAPSHLPPQEGFFFGSTTIDDWYMQDLEDTKKILDEVLAEVEADSKVGYSGDYYYHASW